MAVGQLVHLSQAQCSQREGAIQHTTKISHGYTVRKKTMGTSSKSGFHYPQVLEPQDHIVQQ